MRALHLAAASVIALGVAGGGPGRADETWARIQHPAIPVTLDLPGDASYQDVRSFPLGNPRRKDRRPIRLTLFGIRPLDENRLRYHAVEIALFWLTEETEGVEEADLVAMPRTLRRARHTESFLRGVLYRGPARVRFRDRGFELIDGAPARAADLERITAPGTPDERTIGGEVYLIAPSRRAALAVVVRFDPQATGHERDVLVPRIVRSIRFGDPDDEPLEVRRLPPERQPA
jgi:hypothetical protein